MKVVEAGSVGAGGIPEVIWLRGIAPEAPLTVLTGVETEGTAGVEVPAGVDATGVDVLPVADETGMLAPDTELLEEPGITADCLFARSAWRRCWLVSCALVEEIKARKAAAAAYFIAGGKMSD